jgi:hypothetical protein
MEEAYVSEDAYTHVVEVLQKGKDIQLTPRQMLNSAMSNLGYVLVHVTHQSDDILDACLEFKSMAKYADRVRDALCAESFAREACMAAHPGVSLPASVEDINLSATEKALLIANSELLRNIKMEVKNQPHLWKTAILENLRQRYHAYFGRMPNDLNLVDIAAIKRYELILYGDIQKKIDVASVKK